MPAAPASWKQPVDLVDVALRDPAADDLVELLGVPRARLVGCEARVGEQLVAADEPASIVSAGRRRGPGDGEVVAVARPVDVARGRERQARAVPPLEHCRSPCRASAAARGC